MDYEQDSCRASRHKETPGRPKFPCSPSGGRTQRSGGLGGTHAPGKKGLPSEAGILTRMKPALREISTSTTMVDT